MTKFEAYQLFLAIKQHFTTPSYDFIKFNGKVRASVDSFEKRKDIYFFEKLARLPDPRGRLIACMLVDITWINDVVSDKGLRAEQAYRKTTESLSYAFKMELNAFPRPVDQMLKMEPSEQYPFLLIMYLNGKVSIHTLVVLNSILNFIPKWNERLKDDLLWPDIHLRIVKYKPFLVFDKDKFRQIAIDCLTTTDK